MELEVKYVEDKGDSQNERVILSVEQDCNVGDFILFDTTYEANKDVSNKMRHSYFFPDKEVKAGDKVVLYTNAGEDRTQKSATSVETHYFHWGLDTTVWNQDGDFAVLVKMADGKVYKV